MNAQEKHLLVNAINIRLERLHTILEANTEISMELAANDDGAANPDKLNRLSVDETLLRLARQEKLDLLDKLECIQSGDAGTCKDCGNTISIQRLLNVPTTRSCTTCASPD